MHNLKEHVGSDQSGRSQPPFCRDLVREAKDHDDLRESGVNKAHTAIDALELHAVDYVASLAHFVTTTVRHAMDDPERLVKVWFKTGQWMVEKMAPGFWKRSRMARQVCGSVKGF